MMRKPPDPYFFGYGSLVNRLTHIYDDARPASVSGWRRQWRHTSLRAVAYLSVVEAEEAEIDGLIAPVPDADWRALDLRERAYDRLALPAGRVRHGLPDPISVEIYRTRPDDDAPPSVRHPILLSYLDTVLAGYENVFGGEGVARFFATTDGWDSPVLDDRRQPVYPRAIAPTGNQRARIDACLDDFGVTRFRP